MGRSHECHHSYLHMLPPTWSTCKPIKCHFVLNCKRPCNLNCSITLLIFCWVCAGPRDRFPFVLFCNRLAVEISKAQEQRHEDWKAESNAKENFSLKHKDSLAMDRDHIFKSKTSAAKNQPCGVERAEWKIQSQAQHHLKISKTVFLKLLLHKSSWDSVLSSFNTSLFAGGFWKPLDKAAIFCLSRKFYFTPVKLQAV